MNMSSPWATFVSEMQALFEGDPDVRIEYLDDEKRIKVYVEKDEKAEALKELLPPEKEFGNVVVEIDVIPANKKKTIADIMEQAFLGNPALDSIARVDSMIGRIDYVVFKKEVVQFYNDNLSDVNGNKSMLYEDIARDVFGGVGISFCTSDK